MKTDLINRLDKLSRDSAAPATQALAAELLSEHARHDVLAAIANLSSDESWSEDREPYRWLDELRQAVTIGD